MNKPHSKLDELTHPNHETLPDDLKYFASCLVNIPQLLDEQELQEMLQKAGHKSYFIDNVVNYMANMGNVYQLWQVKISQNDDSLSLPLWSEHDNLGPMQTAVIVTLNVNRNDCSITHSSLTTQTYYLSYRTMLPAHLCVEKCSFPNK